MFSVDVKWKFFRILILSTICFFIWFVFTLEINIYTVLVGMLMPVIVAFSSYDIFINRDELHKSSFFFRIDIFFFYIILIVMESYLSAFSLFKLIFTRDYKPGVIRIKTKIRSELGRTILANSITLIPGTLALWQEKNYIYVHWYNASTRNSLKASKLIKGRIEAVLRRIFE